MRAFVLTAPRSAVITQVPPPVAGPGQVVVDVTRVGVCGTDVEFYSGEMAYLKQGHARYPLRLGHEWCGTVSAVGDGVDEALLGTRTTGDTMLGCGACHRCRTGRHHVCADRSEIGIRNGHPGALAERLLVPAHALHALPACLDDTAGALVEPGGNALRAVREAQLGPGDRLLVLGPGTIGLLTGLFARAAGAEVHFLGQTRASLDFARNLGFDHVWTRETLPGPGFDAVIDASNAASLPAAALDLVEPGKRVVYIGLAGRPSPIDTRALVLKDVTAVGILGASAGLAGAIQGYASGAVDPRPLVAATIGFEELAGVLAGERPAGAGPGPKIHVDPRRPPGHGCP